MMFMLGERIFNLTSPDQHCEDVGIRYIRDISDTDPTALFLFFMWIPVAVAVASGEDILNEII